MHRLLNDLGVHLGHLFQAFGDSVALEKAIEFLTNAVLIIPDEHPDKAICVASLAITYNIRYESLKDPEDLSARIRHLSWAIDLAPKGDSRILKWIADLGEAYRSRFELTRNENDSTMSIEWCSKGLMLIPDSVVERSIFLRGLGVMYSIRYDRIGHLSDIDMAIENMTQAISLASDEDKHTYLDNLGVFHVKRFEHLKYPADLDLGINYMARAALYEPGRGHDEHFCQINSGMAHLMRYDLSGDLDDLKMANECYGGVTSNIALGGTSNPEHLGGLAMCFYRRFDSHHELGDLDKSIEYLDHGLSLLGDDHSLRHYFLYHIAKAYNERYAHVRKDDDLDRAIDCLQKAVSNSPDQYMILPIALNFLGDACLVRFDLYNNMQDLNLASTSYLRSSQASGFFYASFLGGVKLAVLVSKYIRTPEPMIAAAKIVMAHIPKYVWLGSPRERRYELASSITETAGLAILSAIQLERYDLALAWFEQSRSIVWSSTIELRAPLDELRIVDAALAERLQSVNQEIECAISLQSQPFFGELLSHRVEGTSQRLRRLVEERERLVTEARLLPNMSTFLALKTVEGVTVSPDFGAIVALHIYKDNSHALIVRPNSDCIECIPLSSLVLSDLVTAQDRMTQLLRHQSRTSRSVIYVPNTGDSIEEILKILWTDIVKPVLDCLGYKKTDSMENRPHITWCTTGPLAFLPLHAAGDYSFPGCSLFDYAISSFTTSLTALPGPHVKPLPLSGILAVGIANTPGLEPLPGATIELNAIGIQASKVPYACLEGEDATVPAVLEAMEKHSWVHFACHAIQDPTRPTDSAFHLHDGPLTLATVAQKRLNEADLAFLSACQTATGDVKMPEEAVHLAAGMIMSGYRRVIATLWSIDDRDAPLVAEKFYSYMLDDKMPNNRKAGRALHYAIGCLREKIGMREFARWAPYIHIGQ